MEEILTIMLTGIRMIIMSAMAISCFVLVYVLFKIFLNAKGFVALCLAALIAICIFVGLGYIFILGLCVNMEEVSANETLD